MAFDVDKFLHYLDDLALSKEEKEEYIHTIWTFVEARADHIFGVHPVQNTRGYGSNKDLQNPIQAIDSKVSIIRKSFAQSAQEAANDNNHNEERERYGT